MSEQASHSPISGRELRRARNVVKKWQREQSKENAAWNWPKDIPATMLQMDVRLEISKNRYERAAALILADKLAKS